MHVVFEKGDIQEWLLSGLSPNPPYCTNCPGAFWPLVHLLTQQVCVFVLCQVLLASGYTLGNPQSSPLLARKGRQHYLEVTEESRQLPLARWKIWNRRVGKSRMEEESREEAGWKKNYIAYLKQEVKFPNHTPAPWLNTQVGFVLNKAPSLPTTGVFVSNFFQK